MTMPINNNNNNNNTSQHQQAFRIIQDKLQRSSSPINANKTTGGDENEDGEDDDDADDDLGDDDDDDYDKSRDPSEGVTEDTDAMVSRMRLDGTDEDDDDDDGDRMDDYGDLEGHQVHTFPANASTANGEPEIREWSAEESEDTDDEDYDDEFIDLTNNNNNNNNQHHHHQNVERGRYRLLGSTNHVVGSSSSSSSSSSASGYTFYNDKDEHDGTPAGSRVNHYTDHGQQRVAVVVPDLYDDSSNKRHRETIEIDFISGRTINRRRGNDVIRFIPSSSASFSLYQQQKPLSSILICVLISYFKIR